MNKKGKVSAVSLNPELGVSGFLLTCPYVSCRHVDSTVVQWFDYSLSHICIILAIRSLLVLVFFPIAMHGNVRFL
jgi:hypothetical protein